MPFCFPSRSTLHAHTDAPPAYGDKPARPQAHTLTDTTERLSRLRALMEEEKIDYYIVPSEDAHASEYTAPTDQRRAYISGFTGSAGTAVIGHADALLWTDSRYWVQAGRELDANWTLVRQGDEGVKGWAEWLAQDAPKGSRIGIDPTLISYTSAQSLTTSLTTSESASTLVYRSTNLVDEVWGSSQPQRDKSAIWVHPLKYAGKPASEKLSDLLSWLSTSAPPASLYFVHALDEIAWLLNLRSVNSIPFNPVFPVFLLLSSQSRTLFVDPSKLPPETLKYLADSLKLSIQPYVGVWDALSSVGKDMPEGARVCVGRGASVEVVRRLGGENKVHLLPGTSPVQLAKALKNPTELEGMRRAYLRDGVAWAKWAAWLAHTVRKTQITEWDAAEKLTEYRRGGEGFAGLAYENISATGPNAALPHYAPSPEGSPAIDTATPYLNDSGAQYFDGTIDTTRTVHFGKPTLEQKRAFTRVLQGHIAVDSLVFPEGTTGLQIDILARRALWHDGLNYGHGTGHGIGSFLSVHEGPHGIGSSVALHVPLRPGNITSNEPGFYLEGSFGIRIESVLAVKVVETRGNFGKARWLGFERLTKVPIDTTLVDWKLLNREERRWLKNHNASVRKELEPFLGDDKRARAWLKMQCC